MSKVVIDTNVSVVANRQADQASPACVLACVDALEKIRAERIVVLDNGYEILTEYRLNLSFAGQPGLGDAFFKWLWQNQANPNHCELVEIHRRAGDQADYEEFPTDPDLNTFDWSDRKFVAASIACADRPPILNAVDSDWWIHRIALGRNGVHVVFLCPEQFDLTG